MRSYRFAPLVAASWFLVAGFGKVLACFNMPVDSVNDRPVVLAAADDVALDWVEGAERVIAPDVAKGTAVRKATNSFSTGGNSLSGGSSVQTGVCGGYYAYISVGGKNICLKSTGDTGGDLSYGHGYIFNSATYESYNSYIFAHNSTALFGGLKDLGVGTGFSVTVGGQTVSYQVSRRVVYCDYSNVGYPCSNYVDPVLNMWDVIRPGRQGADLSLMTCAGASIGGGDATHRLVIFARRV